MNSNKGFTLIELLVVVAIIGILSTIVITNLSSSRDGANDAVVKANLSSIRNQAEVYYNGPGNSSYGAPLVLTADCKAGAGTSMFGADATILNAITAAQVANGDNAVSCISEGSDTAANKWAVMSPLRTSDTNGNWCVDSTGYAGTAGQITNAKCEAAA
ncbi:MAG: type II secretion system protein [bacterium]|nr:type II secretion system protein [bacterium]